MISLSDRWSSRCAFILATTGAAVGLGNIWRFPYMAGVNGGSAFFLVYLVCVLFMGLPVLAAELLIGRYTRRNPVEALKHIAQENQVTPAWRMFGWWGLTSLMLVLSFYSVVSGWGIAYFLKSLSGTFYQASAEQIQQTWNAFLASPSQLLIYHTTFMFLTILIVIRGVKKGLEKANNIMMPLLYLILVLLLIFACSVGEAKQAAHFLFAFNWADITPGIVVAAMGHAFFTLAVGAGAMLTYGAYAPSKVNIIHSILIIAILDVMVAILAGMAIFPIVFAHHLPPTSGPGLMFITLPISFAHMPLGSFVSAGFFVLLFFASLTSSINLAEPIIITLQDKLRISRCLASIITGFLAWSIGILSLLSFNVGKNVKLFNQTLFDLIANVATDIFLPIGGLGFALIAGYVMKRSVTRKELNESSSYLLWRFLIRYVAPVGIVIVFFSGFIQSP